MGRRNEHSPDELRQLIIQEAVEALNQQPASEMSLRQLAKRVGYAPGSLIHLFSSYNLLLLAVNGYTLDEMHHHAETAATQSCDDPSQCLQLLAEAYLNFAQRFPHRWQLVFDHTMAEGAPIPEHHQQKIDRLFTSIEKPLHQLLPGLNSQQLQTESRILWASIHGITQLAVNDKLFAPQQVSSVFMLHTLLNNYLSGLLKNQPQRNG